MPIIVASFCLLRISNIRIFDILQNMTKMSENTQKCNFVR